MKMVSLIRWFALGSPVLVAASSVLPDDISRESSEIARARVAEKWLDWKGQMDETIHFQWSTAYLSMVMGAVGDSGPGAAGELLVQGFWDPFQEWMEHSVELRYRIRHRHDYGGVAPSGLADEMGALWGVVHGFTGRGLEVPDCFLLHQLRGTGVELRYGQMSIDSQFGGHQLASSRIYFVNQAFASDPGIAFPRFGAGMTASKDFGNGWSFGVGSTTIQGTQVGKQVDFDYASSDFFQVAEVAWQFHGFAGQDHRLALLGWRSDAVEDLGQPGGIGMQITHECTLDGSDAHWFASISWANGGANSLDGMGAAGIGLPCGEEDFLGFAVGYGKAQDAVRTHQAVFEGFYRWQALDHMQISPDVQLLFGDQLASQINLDVIFGLRLVAAF